MSRHRLRERPHRRALAYVVRYLAFGVRWLRQHIEADPETWRNLINGTVMLLVMAFLIVLVLTLAPIAGIGWAMLIVAAGCGSLYGGLVWLGNRR